MKIAFIGEQTLNSKAVELGSRFVRFGHEVAAYEQGIERSMHVNGIRFYRLSRILSIFHAVVVFRADVLHFTDSKPMKWLARLLRPSAVILTSEMLHGISPRRVSTDDVVLQSMGLRSGSFVALLEGKGKKPDHPILKNWMHHDVKLAVLNENEVSRTTRNAIFAGARFVILPSGASFEDALEAMTYGRAVLAPKNLQGLQFIESAVVSYDQTSIEDLKELVQKFIEDPMYAASVGHVAREYVEAEFHWDVVAGQMIEVYTDLCYSASVWTNKKRKTS